MLWFASGVSSLLTLNGTNPEFIIPLTNVNNLALKVWVLIKIDLRHTGSINVCWMDMNFFYLISVKFFTIATRTKPNIMYYNVIEENSYDQCDQIGLFFYRSLQQFFRQKWSKHLPTFGTILKTSLFKCKCFRPFLSIFCLKFGQILLQHLVTLAMAKNIKQE